VGRALTGLLRERGVEVEHHAFPADTVGLMTVSPLLQLAGTALVHGEGLVVGTSPLGHIALLRLLRGGGTEG
jgi:hypothetical protein